MLNEITIETKGQVDHENLVQFQILGAGEVLYETALPRGSFEMKGTANEKLEVVCAMPFTMEQSNGRFFIRTLQSQ
jgi:hypothetical protein